MNCEFCNSAVHIWFQCPKKPDGWKPARLANKSTAARKDVRSGEEARTATAPSPAIKQRAKQRAEAGTQALPVDTSSKRGRKPVDNPTPRQLYQRQLMRDRRARLKAQKEQGE